MAKNEKFNDTKSKGTFYYIKLRIFVDQKTTLREWEKKIHRVS